MQTHPQATRLAVAPMMDWTDRHCRYFMRLLNPAITLYTEMVTAAALTHGDAARLLQFDPSEHPVVLQLGGSDPSMMADATAMADEAGYDEININVGCPSDRVQSGAFGACLMAEPETVAACVTAMRNVTDKPVTVKTRIGIDDKDSYAFLETFVDTVADAGCQSFVVHARIAILEGLSPKENRTIPPLKYERVYQLKSDRPRLSIMLNGGVTTEEEIQTHLQRVDGVMIGRQAYQQPWFLAELAASDGGRAITTRAEAVEAMYPYIRDELAKGTPLKRITRHMLGLFAGQPGARNWRRYLSENVHRYQGDDVEILQQALQQLPTAA